MTKQYYLKKTGIMVFKDPILKNFEIRDFNYFDYLPKSTLGLG